MARLCYLVGKRASGTTGAAAHMATTTYNTSGGGAVFVLTCNAVHARFFSARVPMAEVVYLVDGNGVEEMASRCRCAPRLACAVLDMVTWSAACPLLHTALDAAERGEIGLLVVCVGHPTQIPPPPSWAQSDWQAILFSEYKASGQMTRRWIDTLKSTKPFQLDTSVQGPSPSSFHGMGPFSFIAALSEYPSSHMSSTHTSNTSALPSDTFTPWDKTESNH